MTKIAIPIIFASVFVLSPPLAIYRASLDTAPNESAQIQGQFPADSTVYVQRSATGVAETVPTLTSSAGQLQFTVPAGYAFDVYKVWVKSNGKTSNTITLNQTQGHNLCSNCYVAGQRPHLVGRNLLAPGKTPAVRWVHQVSGISTALPVDMANVVCDKWELVLQPLPALAVGSYDIYATNGYGTEVKVDFPVEILASAADLYNLNVGWGSSLTATNSRTLADTGSRTQNYANLVAAIQQLAALPTGQRGPVRLPAGTFDIEGDAINFVSEVPVVGQGVGQTTLRYGWGSNVDYQFLWNGDLRRTGLADMKIICVNDNGQKTRHLRQSSGQITECFLARLDWTYSGEGLRLLSAQTRLVVRDCVLRHSRNRTASEDVRDGPFNFWGTTHARITGNTILYDIGQIHYLRNDSVWDEGNHSVRNFANQLTRTQDGKLVGYDTRTKSNNLGIRYTSVRNTKTAIDDATGKKVSTNDDEYLITEGAGGSGYQDTGYGRVLTSMGLVLTVGESRYASLSRYACVSIIAGTGAGQLRRITSSTATTLTVDRAWDTPLDATSVYAVATMSLEKSLVKGDAVENGIGAFFNGYRSTVSQVAIVNNKSTDHDGIVFQTAQRSYPPLDFSTQADIQIDGNLIKNTKNISAPEIAIQSVASGTDLTYRGTSFFGIEVKNNAIVSRRDYVAPRPYFYNEMGEAGYSVANLMQQLTADSQFNTVASAKPILGLLAQNNYAEGVEAVLHTNEGSYNTVFRGTKTRNCNQFKKSEKIGPYQHLDIGTLELETTVDTAVASAVTATT